MTETGLEVQKVVDLLRAKFEEARQAGYDRGWREGYSRAVTELMDAATGAVEPERRRGNRRLPRHARRDAATGAVEPKPEPPVGAEPTMPPSLNRALQFIEEHPGCTQHQFNMTVGRCNKAAMYVLHQLGLVERRGAQFFPLNAHARA